MHAPSLITAIFAMAALTAAAVLPNVLPGSGNDSSVNTLTVSDASQKCGNDQVISCCNSSRTDKNEGYLLGAGVADGLLGGNCQPIPLGVVQVPLSQACGDNTAACCSGDQTGLVNLQCNPINVL